MDVGIYFIQCEGKKNGYVMGFTCNWNQNGDWISLMLSGIMAVNVRLVKMRYLAMTENIVSHGYCGGCSIVAVADLSHLTLLTPTASRCTLAHPGSTSCNAGMYQCLKLALRFYVQINRQPVDILTRKLTRYPYL